MNFRLPPVLQTVPAAVQGIPASIQKAPPRLRLILGLAGIAVLLGVVWLAFGAGGGRPEHGIDAPPVHAATAQEKTVTVVEHTIGKVLANMTVNITSRVDGQIATAEFTEGQMVKRGDILFTLDPKPFQAALEQAQAQLARDEAQQVSAQRDYQRYARLSKEGAISAQQMDQARAAAGAMSGSVKADQAAIDIAKLNLTYSVIRSPIDGKTGPILLQPGNLVKANDTNTMVTIAQVKPVKMSFALPQSDLPRIQEREKAGTLRAAVTVHGAQDRVITAPVDFVDNTVNDQTGTIELRATFANDDLALVPGQLLDVAVSLNTLPNATVVPRQAVNVGPDGNYVFVIDKNGLADMRKVEVLFDDGQTAAIKGSVKPGDKVITDGQLSVLPGKPVTIVAAEDGASKSAPDAQ